MITSAATASAWVSSGSDRLIEVEAVVADGHADAEEEQQARHAQPVRQPRPEHPEHQQGRAAEQQLVGRQLDVHGPRLRLRSGQPS